MKLTKLLTLALILLPLAACSTPKEPMALEPTPTVEASSTPETTPETVVVDDGMPETYGEDMGITEEQIRENFEKVMAEKYAKPAQ